MDLSFLRRFHDDNDDEEDVNNANDGSDTEMEVDSHPLMDTDGFNDDFGQDDPFGDQDDQDDGIGQEDLQDGQDPEKVEDAFEDLDEQIAIQRADLGAENNFAVDSEEILIKGHSDMYSYFDSALLRNWAGPDHWKLRRIAKGRAS
jgi:condensin complex subunit 2